MLTNCNLWFNNPQPQSGLALPPSPTPYLDEDNETVTPLDKANQAFFEEYIDPPLASEESFSYLSVEKQPDTGDAWSWTKEKTAQVGSSILSFIRNPFQIFSCASAEAAPQPNFASQKNSSSWTEKKSLKTTSFDFERGGVSKVSNTSELFVTDVDLNSIDELGMTPLHRAALKGDLTTVEALLARGADVNAVDVLGKTPLHWAAQKKGASTIVEALLVRGADVNAVGRDEMTPLHWAAERGDLTTVEVLLAHGANVDAKDGVGKTPLHYAIIHNRKLPTTRTLLEAGADANLLCLAGASPLNTAISFSEISISKALLNAGADPDLPDKKGLPLHLAIQKREYLIIEELLKKKADVTKVDGEGKTAVDRALETGDPRILELFELNYGGERSA